MTTVAEQDPRTGLGKAIAAFVRSLKTDGEKTDAEVIKIAKAGGVSRAAIYRWMSDENSCRNILTAKAIRKYIEGGDEASEEN